MILRLITYQKSHGSEKTRWLRTAVRIAGILGVCVFGWMAAALSAGSETAPSPDPSPNNPGTEWLAAEGTDTNDPNTLTVGAERVVVAVDAEEGFVKTKGWSERTEVRALDLAKKLALAGVGEILYTDISRDGMMQRANIEGIKELAESSGLGVIASGGVTDLEDLRALKRLEGAGVTGVIVGRALYEGRFSVTEAQAVLG